MSIAWPEGVVDSLPQGDGEPTAELTGTSAATLLGLAAAYQTAQFRISTSAEQASMRLWRQQRPLTTPDLTSWMLSWNALLAGFAAQQAALTRAYANTALSRFGTTLPGVGSVPPFPTGAQEWLNSEYGSIAPASLRAAAAAAADAVENGTGTVLDAALLNRLGWLHSPVIKQRWHVSEGTDFDTALDNVSSFVSGQAYNAGRDVESLLMDAANWPSFKNGTAMVYKRVPQAGACGWCLLVATRLWSLQAKVRAEKKPFHVACRCAWALVTQAEAQAYADQLSQSNGNYYAAAQSIGNWQGPLPTSYRPTLNQRFNAAEAARDGYTSRPATEDERARLAEERARTQRSRGASGRSTGNVRVVDPAREAQAAALTAQAAPIIAQAQAAARAQDFTTARRLYEQARRLTSRAYDLRTT